MTAGRWETKPAPDFLIPNQITVIQIYGNLFFANVYSADELLPSHKGITNAVLIYSMTACALRGFLLDYNLSALISVVDALMMRLDVASLDQEEALPIPWPPETFILDPEI